MKYRHVSVRTPQERDFCFLEIPMPEKNIEAPHPRKKKPAPRPAELLPARITSHSRYDVGRYSHTGLGFGIKPGYYLRSENNP